MAWAAELPRALWGPKEELGAQEGAVLCQHGLEGWVEVLILTRGKSQHVLDGNSYPVH